MLENHVKRRIAEYESSRSEYRIERPPKDEYLVVPVADVGRFVSSALNSRVSDTGCVPACFLRERQRRDPNENGTCNMPAANLVK